MVFNTGKNFYIIKVIGQLFIFVLNLFRSEMSSYDCFEVGRQAYNIGDAFHTITWMQEALFRLNNTADTDRAYHLARISVISYLAFSTYELGKLKT